jgi:hypothetical protein
MRITKRQLRRIIKEEKAKVLAENRVRRIVRRRLAETRLGGEGGAAAGGMVVAVDGAYETPEGAFVTDTEHHPLDQLQDIVDMGVTQVDDSDGMRGVIPIEQWKSIIVSYVSDPDEEIDDIYGPPTRWKGGR